MDYASIIESERCAVKLNLGKEKGGSFLPPYMIYLLGRITIRPRAIREWPLRVWLEVALQQAFQTTAVAGLAGYLLISEATASINAFALPKSANL